MDDGYNLRSGKPPVPVKNIHGKRIRRKICGIKLKQNKRRRVTTKTVSIPSVPSDEFLPSLDESSESYNSDVDKDRLTRDGYVGDGFVVDYSSDEDGEYPVYKSHYRNKNSWKKSVPSDIIPELESELNEIRTMIKNETPTIPKILQANITKSDKKRCIILMDQLNHTQPFTSDYDSLIIEINGIIGKGDSFSKEDIEQLEAEEKNLRSINGDKDNLKIRILKLDAAPEIKSHLLSQYDEMMSYPPDSSIHTSLKEEIEWSVRLPYQRQEEDGFLVGINDGKELNQLYCRIREELDKELYGMEKIKDRLLHIINDRRSSKDTCGRNLAIVGSPGTGKTQICKVLAKVLNKKFAKISAGSLDNAAIKGSNRVWQGSEPSIILQKLAKLKTNNALMMIDEVDKVDKKTQHALLHVSDPGDNKEFQDNYLNKYPHDFSKIFFVYCLNDDSCLDEALKDRFDIIYLDDYTNEEKVIIFRDYMLPKALIEIGMKPTDVKISSVIIGGYIKQNKGIGLRNVYKTIKNLVGKVNMYNNILLPDGTVGDMKLDYVIPNFKLPLKIDSKLFNSLIV